VNSDDTIDHLFRHEYGKMVSSLTRIYGLDNLELIEDAVQDTFKKAILHFRNHPMPDNLQAWLRKAVKNGAIDLFRKAQVRQKFSSSSGPGFMSMFEVFSDREIQDSQLRLLFTICHPDLKPKDQIIFALKTFSGFSISEIASALLLDKENIKKSLLRARKKIKDQKINFQVPTGLQIKMRLDAVHLALYLLFSEGYHSSSQNELVRKDLVAEALRLADLVLERFKNYETSALMALMCFHSARLNSKVDDEGNFITLEFQDRSRWNYQLIWKGHMHMSNACDAEFYSHYHWEAAIASEYATPESFKNTDWKQLEIYHRKLQECAPSSLNLLNLVAVLIQQSKLEESKSILKGIHPAQLKGKKHLYYSVQAELYKKKGEMDLYRSSLIKALEKSNNSYESRMIKRKIKE